MSPYSLAASQVIMTAEASRRFGLTARALRYYEERGLLEVARDWQNRRCYDEPAQRRLAWIAALRQARLPLRDIEDVLIAATREGRGADIADAKLADLAESYSALLKRTEDARSSISRHRAPMAA